MDNQVTVSVVQMNCIRGEKQRNLARAEKFIDEAARRGSRLVVLPELFSTGYRVEWDDEKLAETIPGPVTDWMRILAKKHSLYLAGAIIEKDDETGQLYDTAVLVGPEGIEGKHRKMHLWSGEEKRFGNGTELQTVTLPFATVGMLICYEIGFPEQSRVLTEKGADIILFPSAFGKARAHVWDVASRARALENGVFVLACNRTGTEDDTVLGGLSRIVSPSTQVLASACADGEAVITADLDLTAVARQRKEVPYLKDLDEKLRIKGF